MNTKSLIFKNGCKATHRKINQLQFPNLRWVSHLIKGNFIFFVEKTWLTKTTVIFFIYETFPFEANISISFSLICPSIWCHRVNAFVSLPTSLSPFVRLQPYIKLYIYVHKKLYGSLLLSTDNFHSQHHGLRYLITTLVSTSSSGTECNWHFSMSSSYLK